MKLINFLYQNNKYIGKLDNGIITPIKEANKNKIESLLDLIRSGLIDISFHDFKLNIEDVKVLSPIENPIRNAFCLGKNYKAHATELKEKIWEKDSISENPIYFSKACYNIISTGDDIDGHFDISEEIDYEAELAIIISKEGKDIKKDEAKDFIFGYTVANDISVRDLQRKHTQWLKGKSLDTHLVLGPVVLIENSLLDFNIRTYVNGELRQNSNSSKMIFDIYSIIEDLSRGMTLYPGDIILTGTPEGVGMGFNPPKYLKKGDIVSCEIDKIGMLKNKIF